MRGRARPASDTSSSQSVTGFRAVLANGSTLWECLSTARCVFWSLLNDCSKKIQCRSAPRLAVLLYRRVCVCACAPCRGYRVAIALLPWKRVLISTIRRSRHFYNTLSSPEGLAFKKNSIISNGSRARMGADAERSSGCRCVSNLTTTRQWE